MRWTIPLLFLLCTSCGWFTGLGDKKVPDHIVKQAFQDILQKKAPKTASAMCGTDVDGLQGIKVSLQKRNDKSTGIVLVEGTPHGAKGKAPTRCEAELEYQFSYKSKTTGSGTSRRTETSWWLDSFKLQKVNTPGVKFVPISESTKDD